MGILLRMQLAGYFDHTKSDSIESASPSLLLYISKVGLQRMRNRLQRRCKVRCCLCSFGVRQRLNRGMWALALTGPIILTAGTYACNGGATHACNGSTTHTSIPLLWTIGSEVSVAITFLLQRASPISRPTTLNMRMPGVLLLVVSSLLILVPTLTRMVVQLSDLSGSIEMSIGAIEMTPMSILMTLKKAAATLFLSTSLRVFFKNKRRCSQKIW